MCPHPESQGGTTQAEGDTLAVLPGAVTAVTAAAATTAPGSRPPCAAQWWRQVALVPVVTPGKVRECEPPWPGAATGPGERDMKLLVHVIANRPVNQTSLRNPAGHLCPRATAATRCKAAHHPSCVSFFAVIAKILLSRVRKRPFQEGSAQSELLAAPGDQRLHFMVPRWLGQGHCVRELATLPAETKHKLWGYVRTGLFGEHWRYRRWFPADFYLNYTEIFCSSHLHPALFPPSPRSAPRAPQKPVDGLSP